MVQLIVLFKSLHYLFQFTYNQVIYGFWYWFLFIVVLDIVYFPDSFGRSVPFSTVQIKQLTSKLAVTNSDFHIKSHLKKHTYSFTNISEGNTIKTSRKLRWCLSVTGNKVLVCTFLRLTKDNKINLFRFHLCRIAQGVFVSKHRLFVYLLRANYITWIVETRTIRTGNYVEKFLGGPLVHTTNCTILGEGKNHRSINRHGRWKRPLYSPESCPSES